jgi:malate/lactate dehydrogenase
MNTTKKKNSNLSNNEPLVNILARQVRKNMDRLDEAEKDIKVAKKILNKITKKHGI